MQKKQKYKRLIRLTTYLLLAILAYWGVKTLIALDPLAERFNGTVSMPQGEVAFEDTQIEVACVRISDEIPETQLVILPKGQSTVSFRVKVPNADNAYYLRYTIFPKGGIGSQDAVAFSNSTQYSNLGVGGLSIMNHVYLKEGYLSNTGMTYDGTDKRALKKEELDGHNLVLAKEPGIQEKTDQIIQSLKLDNLTALQKERAIYDFVVDYLPITGETVKNFVKRAVQEYENPLLSALMDQKSVWLGHPFLTKWLLHSAGVDSELVEAHKKAFNFTTVYNLVHIDQNNYFLDTLSASQKIVDGVREDGEIAFENQAQAEEYFSNRYFNFTDDFIANQKLRETTETGEPSNACHGAGFGLIAQVIEANQPTLSEGDVVHIRGQVALPFGVQAPRNGLPVEVTISSGLESETLTDDFVSVHTVLIPQGKRKGKFELDFIKTNQPVALSIKEYRANLHGSVQLEAKEASEIEVEVAIAP